MPFNLCRIARQSLTHLLNLSQVQAALTKFIATNLNTMKMIIKLWAHYFDIALIENSLANITLYNVT